MQRQHGNSSRLWLIRHGETEWSRSGQHTGRTDVPLTDAGIQNARALGRLLEGHEFSLILTSPLSRARETCRLAGYGEKAETEPNLAEWDYGVFEGRKTADIRAEIPDWSIWTAQVSNGESLLNVAERARRVIDKSVEAGGNVALFSHGHMLRILTACWLGLPPQAGRLFFLSTATVSTLGHEREIRVIETWNHSAV
jgi:broad specificity phosphatase PhoE